MPSTKAPKASLSQVSLSFGLLTITVDLVPAQRSKKSKEAARPTVSNICPACDTPTKLSQKLFCSEVADHGPYTPAEAGKAVEVDGKLTRVDAEAVDAAKKPEVSSHLVPLSLFPAEQVERHTLPSGNIYRVRLKKPSDATVQNYALLRRLVEDRTDVAFLGEAVLKGATKLYRVVLWQGDLVLTELIRPGEFYEPEAIEAWCEDGHVKVGNALIDASLEEFDPELFNDRAEQRLAKLREALTAGATPEEEIPSPEAAEAATDLLALLEESVARAA